MNSIEESVNDIVGLLLDDYEKRRASEEIKIFNHPDREAIVDILTSLRKIIFPGYFRNRSIKVYTLRNNLSMLIEDVIYKLTKQMTIVLDGDESTDNDITEKAEKIALKFIEKNFIV